MEWIWTTVENWKAESGYSITGTQMQVRLESHSRISCQHCVNSQMVDDAPLPKTLLLPMPKCVSPPCTLPHSFMTATFLNVSKQRRVSHRLNLVYKAVILLRLLSAHVWLARTLQTIATVVNTHLTCAWTVLSLLLTLASSSLEPRNQGKQSPSNSRRIVGLQKFP